MKVIGVLQGISAYREIPEEYVPERLAPLTDIVQTVRSAYQFQQFPMFAPNAPVMTTLSFHNGRHAHNNTVFGITQLVMTPKGDSVATASTDQSDLVLEHLIELLDTRLGYRLRQSNKTKIYWSHVVVEFETGSEEHIGKIAAVERIISQHVGKSRTFKVKGTVFGTSTSQIPPNADTIDILDAQDFVIERRVDHPFEQNRFFSSAPLSTAQHIRALHDIEAALRG